MIPLRLFGAYSSLFITNLLAYMAWIETFYCFKLSFPVHYQKNKHSNA